MDTTLGLTTEMFAGAQTRGVLLLKVGVEPL